MDAEGAVPPISRETSSVQVVTHPIAEMHDPGPGHPEQPARIKAVWDLLRTQDVVAITWHSAEPADRRDVEDVHSPDYLDLLAAMDRAGGGAIQSRGRVPGSRGCDPRRRVGASREAGVRSRTTSRAPCLPGSLDGVLSPQ